MLRINGDLPAVMHMAIETDTVEDLQRLFAFLYERDVELDIRGIDPATPAIDAIGYFYREGEFPDKLSPDKAYMFSKVDIERKGDGFTWASRT